MLEHADQLEYGYGQTKWLAEQIVNSAAKNGLPVVISRYIYFKIKQQQKGFVNLLISIRCGNIGGSSYLPVWNDNDLILLILQGVILSQTAPDIDWQVLMSSLMPFVMVPL